MSYHITPYHIISYHLLSQAVLQTHRALYVQRQRGGEDPAKSSNTGSTTETQSNGSRPTRNTTTIHLTLNYLLLQAYLHVYQL